MRSSIPLGLGARRELLRVERVLPMEGEVYVSQGRRLRPHDLVARGELPGYASALPVAGLGAGDDGEGSVRLLKQPGDTVVAGEVIAVKRGFLGRERPVCTSPEAGVVVAVEAAKGYIVIGAPAQTLDLAAGVTGVVASVVPQRGAVIEVNAVHAQGLLMCGAETFGALRAGARNPGDAVQPDAASSGCILFGGTADDEIIAAASRAGVRALVVGSIPAATWLRLRAGAVPEVAIFVSEGIGRTPMAERTFGELLDVQGQIALLVPRGVAARPELVVSVEGATYVEAALPKLEIGAGVRVAAGPCAGQWGHVVALPGAARRLPGGLVCQLADVALVRGERLSVPLANLELVG